MSHLNLLRHPLAWGSQDVNLPLSAQGSGPWEVVTPRHACGSASPGVPGGQHSSTCLGIWFLEGCHASICSGIHHSRDPRRLTCLDLPCIWFLGGCHASTCWVPPVQGSHEVDMPRPRPARDLILGRLICLNLPGDLTSRRLSCLNLPEDLHLDLGTPGSQVATVLGRISFRKTHP